MRKLLVVMLCSVWTAGMQAQPPLSDTAIYNRAYQQAINQYHQATGDYAPIYIGQNFINYSHKIIGFAFFDSADWKTGNLVYNDVAYNHVQFKYDLVKDNILIRHPDDYTVVILYSPRVNSFNFGDARFVYLDSITHPSLSRSGFYQQLNEGPLTILVKRSKYIEETTNNRELEFRFLTKNNYYAFINGAFHFISNEKSVYKLLDGQTESIKAYLRKNHIKFRKQKELALITIAAQYNQQIKK